MDDDRDKVRCDGRQFHSALFIKPTFTISIYAYMDTHTHTYTHPYVRMNEMSVYACMCARMWQLKVFMNEAAIMNGVGFFSFLLFVAIYCCVDCAYVLAVVYFINKLTTIQTQTHAHHVSLYKYSDI